MSVTRGIITLKNVVTEIPYGISDCEAISEDIKSAAEWGSNFTDKKKT